jgi:hypothetical protein
MRRAFRVSAVLLFLCTLAAVLYFSLVPNIRGRMFYALPRPVAYWCGMHDNLANLAAFALLGIVGFWMSRIFSARHEPGHGVAIPRRAVARRIWLGSLLMLVCILEVGQIGIQGRDSSLWDVVVGWTGVAGAWLLCAAFERLARKA